MKRFLSLLLVLTMCLGMLPVGAGADPMEEPQGEITAASSFDTEETEETTEPQETEETAQPEEPEETEEVSEEAQLREAEPVLVITEQPEDTLTVEGVAYFAVTAQVLRDGEAEEAALVYQWQQMIEDTWVDLEGQTGEILVAEDPDLGDTFRCVVSWEGLTAVSEEAAVTGEEESPEIVSDVWINPEYSDLYSEADFADFHNFAVTASNTVCHSEEEVLAILREALLNKKTSVAVDYDYPVDDGAAYANELVSLMFAHTGNPKEGDYLRYSTGGFWKSYSSNGGYFALSDIQYYTTAAQEAQADAAVRSILDSLNLTGKTQKQKVDAIYSWLTNNVTYDHKNLNDDSYTTKYAGFAALVNRTAVCQGYAGAFYRLCLESGVDSRVISCHNMDHAWNIVRLGDSYYHLDATWDANWPSSPQYYLKGTVNWLENHKNANTKNISELGDQYTDSETGAAFTASYPVPEEDYKEPTTPVTTVTVTIADGEKTEERQLKAGSRYFDYDLTLKDSDEEPLAALRITDKDGNTRLITRSTADDSANVLTDDVKVELLRESAVVTIRFYADSDGTNLLSILTIRKGEPLEALPKLDGEAVEWYTEDGELLEEGKIYDFQTGLVNAYPKQSGEENPNRCGENLTWLFENGMLRISGTGDMWDYSGNAPWTEFWEKIYSVVADDGVESIGDGAFADCKNLKTVQLPDTLFLIGDSSFAGCTSLTKLNFPDSLRYIGDSTFAGCKGLTGELRLPEEMEEIGDCAFMGTGYTSLELPGKLGYIGAYAFADCTGLKGTLTLPENLRHLGAAAFENCAGLTGRLTIPSGLTQIYGKTFSGCKNLKGELTIYEGLESIGDWAFYGCGFTGMLRLPSTIKTVGYSAFQGCTGFTGLDLRLSESLETIGAEAFAGCTGIQGELDLPNSVKIVDDYAFRGCTKIRGNAYLSGDLTRVGMGAFSGTGITGFSVSEHNKTFVSIEGMLFTIDAGTLLVVPCGMTGRVEIPIGTQTVASNAFIGCNQITALSICDDRLSRFENSAFDGCTKLTDIYYAGTRDQWNAIQGHEQLEGKKLHLVYTITYMNVPEDVENPNPTTWETGTAVTLKNLNRARYEFLGWFDRPSEGKQIQSIARDNADNLLLYARWREKGCSIVFDGNGAQSGETAGVGAAWDTTVQLPENGFVRPGYTFTAWNTRADGRGKAYKPGDSVKNLQAQGTVTLYAQWKPCSFTAKFASGNENAQGTTKDITGILNGRTFALPRCGYTLTGYLFAGWKDKGFDEILPAGEKISYEGIPEGNEILFTAQWTPITYTVRFNANRGTNRMADQVGLSYDETVALDKNAFQRAGYHFVGWNTRADGKGTQYEDEAEVSNLTAANKAVVTLYAQWEGNEYTLTFHNGDDTRTQKLHYGTTEALEQNSFTKPGYTFAGWNTQKNGRGRGFRDMSKVMNLNGGLADTDLYAQWTANRYTVIFHSNLQRDAIRKQVLVYDAKETALAANGFAWKGHAFQGWALEKDSENVDYANKKPVQNLTTGQTIDLYAVWKDNVYTVVFDGNGADRGAMSDLPMVYDKAGSLTANSFERDGYDFSGWSTNVRGRVVYKEGAEVKNLTDRDGAEVRLYAVWAPHSYTVEFSQGEGNVIGAMRPMTLIYGRSYALSPLGFKRSNYTFTGWKLEGETELLPNRAKVQDLAVQGSVTLTAQWEPTKYAIAYQGLTTAEKAELLTEYDVEMIALPGFPSRPGCKFEGWYLDARCTRPFRDFAHCAGVLRLYPKWSGTAAKYTVAYAPGADNTTGATAKQTGLVSGREYAPKGSGFRRSGYLFTGWLLPDGKKMITTRDRFSNLCAEDGEEVTLTAQWTPIAYNVRFNANRGTGRMADQKGIKYDQPTALNANQFTRKGYTFRGWNTRADGKGAAYADQGEVTNLTAANNATVTLCAQWEANTYTVHFDGNGGVGEMKSIEMTYDQPAKLTSNGFTMDGGTFLGWTPVQGSTKVIYRNAASVKNLAESGEITLYAVWKK